MKDRVTIEEMTTEHFDLETEMERLWWLVRDRLPEIDPARVRFEETMDLPDYYFASLERLQALRSYFYNDLGEAKRLHILGGWPPVPDGRPSPAELLEAMHEWAGRDMPAGRVLSLFASPSGVDFYQAFELTHTFRGSVHVEIGEGITQAAALRDLLAIAHEIVTKWPEMMAKDPKF